MQATIEDAARMFIRHWRLTWKNQGKEKVRESLLMLKEGKKKENIKSLKYIKNV